MKIVDKTKRQELTEYHVGDVILQNDETFLIVKDEDEYTQIRLETGCVATIYYDTLEEMFELEHTEHEKLVTATLTIE